MMYEGVDALLLIFLIPALDGDEWLASHSSSFIPKERVLVPTGEERRLYGPQSWSACSGEEKYLHPCWEPYSSFLVIQPIA
jgi:hypothetical protein